MAARFWVGGTGTWDNADTTNWSASTGGANGASVPASGDIVTFDGSSGGGTCTVAATINASNTITSITAGAFTGTIDFSANNPAITAATASWSGTGARTFVWGTGQWTLTGTTGTVWDNATITNQTYTNAPALLLSATPTAARTVAIGNGARTISSLEVNNTGAGSSAAVYPVLLSGAGAFITNFIPTNLMELGIAAGSSAAITNSFSWAGTPFAPKILRTNRSPGISDSLRFFAGAVLNWVAIGGLNNIGTAVVATNSFDLGGNTGFTITPPSGAHIVGG